MAHSSPNGGGLFPQLRRLFDHLHPRRRMQFGLLLVLIVVSAFAEVLSLGAVLPFLGVLTAPDRVFSNPAIGGIARSLGIGSADALLLPVSVAFAAAAIFAGIIRIVLLWANTRLAYGAGADLSIAVYRRTLYQPYQVHIGRNSSEVVSGITRKVDLVVTGMILPVLVFVGSALLLVAITVTLFAIDPFVATIAMVGFGSCYGVITVVSRRRIYSDSVRMAEKQAEIFRALQEGLNGIRDVLLNSAQERYSRIYRQADLPLRR
ncbi:MAG: ABC transporter transmembrane domain-containing protein, partial [Cypionkella sp.]